MEWQVKKPCFRNLRKYNPRIQVDDFYLLQLYNNLTLIIKFFRDSMLKQDIIFYEKIHFILIILFK